MPVRPPLWPLLLTLACAHEPRPLPQLHATRSPPTSATPPAPAPAPAPTPELPVDLCPDDDETPNSYRDDDGCPDEQPIGMAYFSSGLRPVLFTPAPQPRRGAPGIPTLFFSTSDDHASESYAHNRLGRFVATATAPRSTVAPSNDTSAWPLLRRFLADGALPPIGVLRIESLIDYFTPPELYSWPRGGPTLAVHSEIGPCPWNPGNRLAHLRLATRLPPIHGRLVVVILDLSHSMSTPDRLPLLKQGLTSLLDGLAVLGDSRVAILGFAHHEALVLPPTPIHERPAIDAAIAGLRTRDLSFNRTRDSQAHALFRQRLPHEQVHIILASDGAQAHGYFPLRLPPPHPDLRVSVVGVGRSDFDHQSLAELATANDGELHYLDSVDEARSTFTNLALWEGGSLVARDIQVQSIFDPATVTRWHLVGHANNQISADEFTQDRPIAEPVPGGPYLGRRRAGDLAGNQAIHLLYELEPTTTAPVSFKVTVRAHVDGRDRRITHVITDPGTTLAATSADFRRTAAVAELGLLIQGGPRGDATLEQVRQLATGADAPAEFLTVVDQVEAHFDERAVHWADTDAWLRAHPIDALPPAVRAASQIPTSSLPTLEFEALRMRAFGRHALVGVHDDREGADANERAAIATARAEAVKRYLLTVMGRPSSDYELRPMTPDDARDNATPAARNRNRRVQLESIIP